MALRATPNFCLESRPGTPPDTTFLAGDPESDPGTTMFARGDDVTHVTSPDMSPLVATMSLTGTLCHMVTT